MVVFGIVDSKVLIRTDSFKANGLIESTQRKNKTLFVNFTQSIKDTVNRDRGKTFKNSTIASNLVCVLKIAHLQGQFVETFFREVKQKASGWRVELC